MADIHKDFLIVIPARSGSIGIPDKNVRPFGGRPLVLWTLELASSFNALSDTLFSSDSELYLELARDNLPDLLLRNRPKGLAAPDTPMSKVIVDACEYAEGALGRRYKWVLLLDVTNPLRTARHVETALGLASNPKTNVDGFVSVSKPHFNPAWVTVKFEENGQISRWYGPGAKFTSRQEAPTLYRMNGIFYMWTFEFAKKMIDPWLERGRFEGVEVEDHQSISIDTEIDFRVAETLFKSGMEFD